MECSACGFTCGTYAAMERHRSRCLSNIRRSSVEPAPPAEPAPARSVRRSNTEKAPQSPSSARAVKFATFENSSATTAGSDLSLGSSEGGSRSSDDGDRTALEAEVAQLRARLQEQEWLLRRERAQHERVASAYAGFVRDLVTSSAAPCLGDHADLSTMELLGSGKFGHVVVCARAGRRSHEQVVVKIQGVRHTNRVALEWHIGSSGEHAHVVQHEQVLLHRDSGREIRNLLERCVTPTSLGRQFPESFLCIVEEHMDAGTAQQLMDANHLNIQCAAAIARQLASALSHMHSRQSTHNDIKPENVLLKTVPTSDRACVQDLSGNRRLVAKLADLGLAEYSSNRARDLDLFAYTIWCMCLSETFKKCPATGAPRQEAVSALRSQAPWRNEDELRTELPAALEQLWAGEDSMVAELRDAPWVANYEILVPEVPTVPMPSGAPAAAAGGLGSGGAVARLPDLGGGGFQDQAPAQEIWPRKRLSRRLQEPPLFTTATMPIRPPSCAKPGGRRPSRSLA